MLFLGGALFGDLVEGRRIAGQAREDAKSPEGQLAASKKDGAETTERKKEQSEYMKKFIIPAVITGMGTITSGVLVFMANTFFK